MLQEMLIKRALPALKPREEMLEILQREEYGYLPEAPGALSFSAPETLSTPRFCAGHAALFRVTARFTLRGRAFAFPFYAAIPTKAGVHPFFVHINFRDAVPDLYMPTEELIDHGFAVLSLCYKDVTSDDGDFSNGLAGCLFADGRRGPADPGKIALWAWAAMRVMDWAETEPSLDRTRAAVCGHSRLGKTALLTAALDTRFAAGYSNDSGCSGAALARGTGGERVRDICRNFPFWFCENYLKWADNEENMPFDQHYLLASIAPRRVLAGSASLDDWADPLSEQLAVLAASPAFGRGLVCPDRPAETGEAFLDGDAGYHLREGAHFFSRADWLKLIEFMQKDR